MTTDYVQLSDSEKLELAVEAGLSDFRQSVREFPLDGGWEWDAQAGLKLSQPIHGHPASVPHQGRYHADSLIVFAGACFRWRGSGEDGAALGTAESFEFETGGCHRGLPNQAQDKRRWERIEFGLPTLRAEIARVELGVRHWNGASPT